MKTDILEGNANDRPNYDVTWTINAAVITEITRQPRQPHRLQNRHTGISCQKAQNAPLALWNRHFEVFKNNWQASLGRDLRYCLCDYWVIHGGASVVSGDGEFVILRVFL